MIDLDKEERALFALLRHISKGDVEGYLSSDDAQALIGLLERSGVVMTEGNPNFKANYRWLFAT